MGETDAACAKDELIAKSVEAQLKKEMTAVAKLEKRERQLAEKKLCVRDLAIAEQLAAEICEEESRLRLNELADRRLAEKLVKDERAALAQLPQTQEKLKELASQINGNAPIPTRTKLRNKLASMRKSQ